MLRELRNLPAPAKLNLFLHVTGRRADGYHLLETVFQFIDLSDTLDLGIREDGTVRRVGESNGIAPELDLALRAATALKSATGSRLGADIRLRKQIPIGAGLGGGSSDAATVLLGLNRLWQLGLKRADLIEIARPLGADVPVFVYGRNAYATGVGDRFRPIALPSRWFVLVTPPVTAATADAFRDPNLTRNTRPITIFGFSKEAPALGGRNDLQAVVAAGMPAVQAALEALRAEVGDLEEGVEDAGAGAGNAAAEVEAGDAASSSVRSSARSSVRMTGSGACVFAAMQSLEKAREAALRVLRHNVGTVQVVAGLAMHPLGSRQVG